MCCSLIHCMAACNCEDVLCLEGFSARSPGSWLGGSWVSALLSGLFCWTPSQDLAPWSGVFRLFLCKISIHWHSCGLSLRAILSVLFPLAFVFLFWLLLCFGLFVFSGPDKTSDCATVRTPLSTPQGGTLKLRMDNSFISTTMCDDLARATEAQDGKKKLQRVRPPTGSTTTGNLNTNHDKNYMRLQEDFLAIAALAPAGAQTQEGSSYKSPPSKAGGILGFGAAEWFVLLDTFARSCTVVWCFSFVSVQDLNSLAQLRPVSPCDLVSAFSAGFCVFVLVVALFWFVCFFWA